LSLTDISYISIKRNLSREWKRWLAAIRRGCRRC